MPFLAVLPPEASLRPWLDVLPVSPLRFLLFSFLFEEAFAIAKHLKIELIF